MSAELWEISFGHTAILFTRPEHALEAAKALALGAVVDGAADPAHPERTVTLRQVECRVRRVFVPVSVRTCIAAYGKRLQPAPELPALNAGS